MKAGLEKWNYIQLKSFFPAKKTINRVKRPPTQWDEIFGNNSSDRG
jgi:hypothetical protein